MYFYNAQRTLLANLVPQNIARRLSRQQASWKFSISIWSLELLPGGCTWRRP